MLLSVWLVCCGERADGRLLYTLSLTSLLVYDEGGFVDGGCVRIVPL